MSIFELLILALAVSMDAFAVAICKGLSMEHATFKKASTVGLYFGVFQAIMPLIGYFLGSQFRDAIRSIDHWIAFILLGFIGYSMMNESRNGCECCGGSDSQVDDSLSFRKMLVLSVATSIDALAVGITLALLNVNIFFSITVIGITTFSFSAFGVKIGNAFGSRLKSRAEFFGGLVLLLIGIKILVDHTGVLSFLPTY